MSASSTIGFHAAYVLDGGNARETGMGNAELGSFLTHLGLRVEAIRFITKAPPNKVSMLTPPLARALGIEVYEQSGFQVTAPAEKPTVDALAARAGLYVGLGTQCSSFFSMDESMLRASAEQAIREAHAIIGGENFAKILVQQIDATKSEIARLGQLNWCLYAEERLRREGRAVLPAGPSFDCAKARSSSEKAICAEAGLSARDRIIGTLYRRAASQAGGDILKRLQSEQSQWLKMRDACSADHKCLEAAYDLRTRQLVH
jgi:uncharacterized protein YecT (DUF1311 family)